MLNWYYEKEELKLAASILDGLAVGKEYEFRRKGARFIMQIGTKLGLRHTTMATGVVFFHRFYMIHSFKKFSKYIVACCCLFLAGKVEETPKKSKDIINTAKSLLSNLEAKEFGDNVKNEMMVVEKVLLKTIKFDFHVEHPYKYLLKYAKSLKGNKKELENMVQMAWTFINDSLCTMLCLQWEPEIIAIALMHLAGKLCRFKVVDWINREKKHLYWWDMYAEGITVDLLEDICHQLLDVYCLESASNKSLNESDTNKSTILNSENPSFSKEECVLLKQLKVSRQRSFPYKKKTQKSLLNCDLKHSQNQYNLDNKTQNNLYPFALNTNQNWLDNNFLETLKSIKALRNTTSQGLTNIIIQQNIVSTSCNFKVPSLNLEHCVSNANTSLEYNFAHNIYRPTESTNTSLCTYELQSQPSSFCYESFKTSAELTALNILHNQNSSLTSNDLSAIGTISKTLPEFPISGVKSQMKHDSYSTVGHDLSQYTTSQTSRIGPSYSQFYPYNKDIQPTDILKLHSSDVVQGDFPLIAQSPSEFSNLSTQTIPISSGENSYFFTCQNPVDMNTELNSSTESKFFLPDTEQQINSALIKDETNYPHGENYYQTRNSTVESASYEISNFTKTFQPVVEASFHVQDPFVRNSLHVNQDSSSSFITHPGYFRNDIPNSIYSQNFYPTLNTSASSSTLHPEQNCGQLQPQDISYFSQPPRNPQFFL